MKNLIGLVVWLAVTLGVGALGAVASVNAASFYANLVRPEWSPPGWLFGPVWTTLYILMAVSVWLVWKQNPSARRTGALEWFVAQLLVNGLWSWLFFAWNMGLWAFVDVALLVLMIGCTVRSFWALNKTASLLLLPYWAWVIFASALTWSVWRANPGVLG
ncbi:tryptophan-rich sensory protein [Limnobacter humi]|uniref:Tryptophan-rich sensory protein n=1 Tax=Limnobacter humi TaxID=1778671 RepID=A0ABT1WK03_9BURK|nr:TspO/MBR family protein [Limnobacter humi]MCQ8897248.1 tryptophan-rich sensory protein [Limnobacter humi]